MKQKKYYKTWKFWITSLLALSASSIITSLTLTSCVANSNANKSDIVIKDQSSDQEFSMDDGTNLTLSVEASSNSGVALHYQWYVNKTSNDDKAWEKIDGATSKTYAISVSDIQDVNSETTWRYKAYVYPENNEHLKVESKPISVKIKPPVGGSVPDKPNTPEPDPTPPENNNPDLNPDLPENPSEPTPPSKPDTPSDPDNPSIVPTPDHIAGQGIGARLPLDKRGIVTTKYEQEKWIGDNSVSIAIMARPNVQGITKAVNNLKSKTTNDANLNVMLDHLIGTINTQVLGGYYYNQFGTGWILDYSDNTTNNLKDYYIATNMHVLNSYFEFFYTSNRYDNSDTNEITVGVRIPFNKTTVSSLDVYISQPKYSTEDQKLNSKSYADKLSAQWYKTNIGINNWNDNLIPIGAYNPNDTNGFGYNTSFDMELTWQYTKNTNIKQTLYFKSSEDGQYLNNLPVSSNSSIQNDVDDFSVFKISLDNKVFDNTNPQSSDADKKMFQNMKALFDTTANAADNISKNSSYIKKLNKLLDITSSSNNYTKDKVDELFMFGESNNITKPQTQISIGGYPLIQEAVKVEGQVQPKWEAYTTFNTNTLTGNNIIDYPPNYYPTRDRMGINQYTYKGNIYKINWKGPNNYILKNVNLLKGSSGGVGIDKDYKISCINWGSFIQIDYFQGIKYVLDSSSSTGLYSSNDKSSLIWKWVDYASKNIQQSKLARLFSQLEKLKYFN